MIRINLNRNRLVLKKGTLTRNRILGVALPPRTYQRMRQVAQDIGLLVTIIICLGLGYVCTLFSNQWKNLMTTQHKDHMRIVNEKILALNSEIGKYGSYQQELQSYEEQKKIANQRLTTVKDLLDQRNAPIQVLDTVGQSLPPKTWVSGLDMNLVQEPGAVNIIGVSFSNEEISDFVDRLSESSSLTEVTLEEVGARVDDKAEFKTFLVNAKPKLKWANRTIAAVKATPTPATVVATAPTADKEKTANDKK